MCLHVGTWDSVVQQQPREPDERPAPAVEELLRAGRELLDQSRRLSDSLDAQLRRYGRAADDVPATEPVESESQPA
jgi:hypothetical protein